MQTVCKQCETPVKTVRRRFPAGRTLARMVRMADLLFVVVIAAFFGCTVLLVKACDRIIGPDLAVVPTSEHHQEIDRVASVSAGAEQEAS